MNLIEALDQAGNGDKIVNYTGGSFVKRKNGKLCYTGGCEISQHFALMQDWKIVKDKVHVKIGDKEGYISQESADSLKAMLND